MIIFIILLTGPQLNNIIKITYITGLTFFTLIQRGHMFSNATVSTLFHLLLFININIKELYFLEL